MTRYIFKRILGMLVVIFLVLTIAFIIVRLAPGDPAALMLGPDATAEDAAGNRFRFAPLESELFDSTRALPDSGFTDGDSIPDSVLVQRPGQAMLVRAEGVLELGRQLGGLWRGLATILSWLPKTLLNAGYDFIASSRHRLFKRPEDACPLLPPELRDRFSS